MRKETAHEATVFVYDASGLLVAEYSNRVERNGMRYVTQDTLGSTRVVTGQGREVAGRYDYLPFGGEVYAWRAGYGGAGSKQKFTGKERDDETGLDYYGARYYGSRLGRFTTTDPLMASGMAIDPQSWNRYAYVGNNPLRFIDEEGLIRRDKFGNVIFVAQPGVIRDRSHPSGERGLVQYGHIFADDGTQIEAFKPVEGGNYHFSTDCHGVTFADGEVWIDNSQIGTLLDGDKYKNVEELGLKPQVGDVVIYTVGGDVVHSMTVTAADENGSVTAVSGVAGLNDESYTTTPAQAWDNPKAKASYYRKVKDDRTLEQRQRNLNRTQSYNKRFNAYMREAMKKINKEIGPPPPLPKPPKKPKGN